MRVAAATLHASRSPPEPLRRHVLGDGEGGMGKIALSRPSPKKREGLSFGR